MIEPEVRMNRVRFGRWLATAAAGVMLVAGATAQPETREQRAELEKQFAQAFRIAQYEDAAALLERLMRLSPTDPLPHYNMACVRAKQGRLTDGEDSLRRAVELGYTAFDQMQRDADLAALRETETFKNLVAQAGALQDAAIDRRMERLRKGFGPSYKYEKDAALRLAFASGFEETSFMAAKEEVSRLAAWWKASVLAEGQPAPERPDPWVMVIWPNRRDWNEWAQKNFGARFGSVGGIYDHNKHELVAQDLGPTMRHEFLHVLHWRDMMFHRQVHAIWVQEGLCSLVEDVQFEKDSPAVLKPLPSWRTNSIKRLQEGGRVMSLKQLVTMQEEKFTGTKPLANYAAARAAFLYLADKGKLREWYAAYVEGFNEDATGAKAFERVFGKPLDQVDKEWKVWLRALPEVAEVNRPGSADLPFGINEAGAGDGLTITSMTAAARQAGLAVRDVVTAIDGKSVRDAGELARVLGEYKPGAVVEVAYRRGKTTGTAKVTLLGRE